MKGWTDVEAGLLMSIAQKSREAGGAHAAEKVAQFFNGASFKEIPLLFEDPQRISINLKVANKIGFEVDDSMFEIADEVFN